MKITKRQLKQIIKEELEAVLREEIGSSIGEGFLDMFKRDPDEEECSEKHEKGSEEYEVCMNTKRANRAAKEQGFKGGMPSPWDKGENIYGYRR